MKVAIAAVVLILLGAAAFFLLSSNSPDVTVTPNEQNSVLEGDTNQTDESMELEESTDESEVMGMETEEEYTLSEVSEHDSAESCWIAIEGKVYDVTSFIGNHPGGQAILQGCGKDATELYNERPNGSGEHSEKARSFLPNYEIGVLISE